MRLLKSRAGYAVKEDDGEILFDVTAQTTEYVDTGLQGRQWYYYTLFLLSDGKWYRVGTGSSLSVTNTGMAALLWEKIPRYFHYVPRNRDGEPVPYFNSAEVFDPDRLDQENQHLRSFLDVLGWGLDYLRDYHQTATTANDPKVIHLENLDRLARTLGTDYEYAVPSRLMRERVANTAHLAQIRGTYKGLRELANATVGWDVEVSLSNNLMLNEDQGSFANPTFPEWSPAVNYATGHVVQYIGRIFRAKTGGAYGLAQKPPAPFGEGDSNTWWDLVTDEVSEVTRNPSTGAVSTWLAWRDGSTEASKAATELAIGISSPLDATERASNSLKVTNISLAGPAFTVWGAANPVDLSLPAPQQEAVIGQGLPIPRALPWQSDKEYAVGELALDQGIAYQCLRLTEDRPAESVDWAAVGVDERPEMMFSFYSHSDFDGSAGVLVGPGLSFYDERGVLVRESTSDSGTGIHILDPFGGPDSALHGRLLPKNFAPTDVWSVVTGDWIIQSEKGQRVATPLNGTGSAYVDSGLGSGNYIYNVGVTFERPGLGSRQQALMLRYQDANNHLRVTRAGVSQVVAGSVTTLATFATPVPDGARVVARINKATNVITVLVNGTEVATITGAFNPSHPANMRHGMQVL